ncbi:MAG TPA: glycosyltransferase family protein [Sediminibacterium sp.]|uniref:glycosyltransferase family protein n=1 Tax=Sediminibacterium sp. TaxID=1917865 RepID=UPI0008B24C35|nr:glycosyltransferase family protein [Sediminibacterium sp.]OHC86354.1 MAG: glycosyl transferase [Sphingobacteriia bacterium RIFOXYC2_FULL_35_18]OHC89866.1 MAG: glycosyl transferase [Sphingobacteriia bacterium RIFOXYD2_FULL_35_12]HLD54230.1 glycosyltransferase family protein [Sediminibacterium sp.]
MKIFYAVQATGNGHIARAKELIPYIQRYGQVDVFLSGNNSNLKVDLPVKYQSNGVSLFYGNRGGLDYFKMAKELSLFNIIKEARSLPVDQYDLVINDFESITSLACKIKQVPSIGFGHQASFKSSLTPRPNKKDWMGEFILNNYASATKYIGLHFEQYDEFIYSPIIKEQVLLASPKNQGHISVYLSHYSDEVVASYLNQLPNQLFHLFSKKEKTVNQRANILYMPIDNALFTESMINAAGVITGAGFETPAEALYLNKKLLCVPIKGQYEQLCNAAALKNFGVPILANLNANFSKQVEAWLNGANQTQLHLSFNTGTIVEKLMETAASMHVHQEEFNQYELDHLSLKFR